jgi:hypothetical protein
MKGKTMAKYDYNALRAAATSGSRIGGWQGWDVYSCSKHDYDASSKHFYVLYDDDKKLVREGYVYGSINSNGTINEVDRRYEYFTPKKKNKPAPTQTTPASGYSAYMAGATGTSTAVEVSNDDFFVRIDREINELLANASKVDLSVSFGE